jgi:hypothetical protein
MIEDMAIIRRIVGSYPSGTMRGRRQTSRIAARAMYNSSSNGIT